MKKDKHPAALCIQGLIYCKIKNISKAKKNLAELEKMGGEMNLINTLKKEIQGLEGRSKAEEEKSADSDKDKN